MASDLDILPGKWHVKVKSWNWEYEFQPGGRVTWRDLGSMEKGSGGWAATSALVNIWWSGSSTRESWQRPLSAASTDRTWYEAPYFKGKYKIEKAGASSGASPSPTDTTTDQQMLETAYQDSRRSLQFALNRLRGLQAQSTAPGATAASLAGFRRDIAVLSYRLVVPADPMAATFQTALASCIRLFEQNLALPKTLTITRAAGKCADPRPAFAWTTPGRRPPDTELCTSWVNARDDLKRDVITHEYFHTVGTGDISVNTTADALGNANTLAQIAAYLNDRRRQRQSDGVVTPPVPED